MQHCLHERGMSNSQAELPTLAIDGVPPDVATTLQGVWAEWWQGADPRDRRVAEQHTKRPPWLKAWAASRWFAQQCIKHPDWLCRIMSDSHRQCTTSSYHKRWRNDQHDLSTHPVSGEAELMRAVRLFKHYEIARIIYRDINRIASTRIVCAETSALAEHLLRVTLEWHYQHLCASFGTPIDAHGTRQQLGIIAMGKLGGNELNLSSDIDLIFVFPSAGKPDRSTIRSIQGSAIDNQEFFEKQARGVINSLSAPTTDGSAWKVDTRLRPYGTDGALVNNHEAMELYYETQGRDWERFAMCRARAVAGDKKNTRALIARLKPFIYRRYLDFNALDALRATHKSIRAQLGAHESESNIKLGSGGIREAEFGVQFFQLAHGGKQPQLQDPGIFKTMKQLVSHRHISATEQTQLRRAYCFLRDTEHALQAYDNLQTHVLPEEPGRRAVLAMAMGCAHWSDFHRQLDAHRKVVKRFFHKLIAPAEVDRGKQHWHDLWHSPGSALAGAQLADADSANTRALVESLEQFRKLPAFARLNEQGHKHLDTFMPRLLECLVSNRADQRAIDSCLEVVSAVLRRSNYLALLAQHPKVLTGWAELCMRSPWLSRKIVEQPMLLGELLDARTMYQSPGAASLQRQLAQQLVAHSNNPTMDPDHARLEALKNFHGTQLLRIAVQDLDHLLAPDELCEQLSATAESLLQAIIKLAARELVERYGAPQGRRRRASEANDYYFCTVAYGKLGSAEMSYGSDLDLVFLYDTVPDGHTDGKTQIENSIFYARLSQRVLAYLKTSGIYETDIRLRPSGHTGVLVSTLDSFRQYQEESAWTWEHQALVAARAMTGSARVRQKFEQIRRAVLGRKRDVARTRSEVLEMRHKMDRELGSKSTDARHRIKHDAGGLIDIEFMVRYTVLASAHRCPGLLVARNTRTLLELIAKNDLVDKKDCASLAGAYNALGTESNHHVLRSHNALPKEQIARYRHQVNRVWHKIFGVARSSIAEGI